MKRTRDTVKVKQTMNGSTTILIVDSDARERKRLSAVFNGNGFKAVTVGTGSEALAAASTKPLDAALLNIDLPDMPGTELIAPLKGLYPGVAIIMLAADPTLDSAMRSLNEGATGYITNPADTDNVLASVADGLEKQRLVMGNRTPHEEIRYGEEHYRMITENMTDTVWVMDLEFRPTYISPSVIKDRGYTLEELRALPLTRHVTPQSLETIRTAIAEEITPERLADKNVTISRSMELEFYRKDGSTYWGEVALALVRDADGKPKEIIGVGRDITERKKSEAALLRAAQEWRTTFDSISDMISIQDADYRILRVNKALADFLKSTPKKLVGKYCYEVIHGTKAPPEFCPHRRAIETGQSIEEEVFEPRLGIFINVVDSPIVDTDGIVTGSVHVIKNVTDRRRDEAALLESEARYRRLFENATVGIFHSLPEGGYLRVNPALARMVGFDSPEEMVSSVKDIASELYVEPGQRSELHKEAIRKGGWATTEGRFKRRDGSIRWGRLSVHPVYNSEGIIEYFEGFTEDITERRISDEKIRESERTLSMAQRIAAMGSWDWDLVTDRLAWSEETFRIFGRDPATYMPIVSDVLTSVHPADRDLLEQKVRTAIERDEPYEHEYRIITGDGTTKHLRAAGEIIHDSQGKPVHLWGAIQDVTERKQREDAVREWKERYELVVAASGQVAYDYDVPTRRIVWGPTIEDLLGYAPEEYGGGFDQWQEWLHPDDREETLRLLDQAEKACSFWDARYRLRHKGGHYVWIRDRGYFVPDEKGVASRQLGMLEDVTERKIAEEKIAYLKQFSENVINFMNDSIDIIDESYRIVFQNRAAKERFGEGIGRICHEFYHGIDVPCSGCVTLEAIREHKQFVKETTYSDGSVLEVHISPIRMPEGHYCSLEIIRDVTERKRTEDALRESDIRFKKLSANVPGMIYQFMRRPDGTYCAPFSSEAIRDIFGCPPEDVRDDFSPVVRVVVPEDLDKLLRSIEESAESMTLWQCEYRVQIPGGPVRWMSGRSTPERLPDGSIIWHGFNTDITERKQAEAELVKSEALLNATQRLAKVGGWQWDLVGQSMYWSDEVYRIHGISAEDVAPGSDQHIRTSIECYDPDDRPVILAAFNRCVEEGVPYDLEFPFTTYRGDRIWIRTTAEPVYQDGRIVRIIGNITDMTERKRAEEALRESEERYRNLVENINDVLFSLDAAGTITYISPAAEAVTGFAPRDYEGKNFAEVVHPDDLPGVIESFGKTMLDIREEAEFRVITKDGSYRYVRSSSNPVVEDGTTVGISGLITDITERKRAEDNLQEINRLLFERTVELRQSEEKFRSLFETSRDFMAITDLEGRFVDTNAAAMEFFGYTPDELSHVTMLDLYSNPEDRQRIIDGIIEKGYVTNLEAKLRRKSGDIVDVLVSVNLKRDEDGRPVHFFSAARDVTEKRRMEQQLLQSEKLSAVGTMISGVAHELNNPLTSIIGNAQLLSRRDVPDDIRVKLDVILKESKRSAKIVGGLLAFAREHKPERKMTDINEIVTESLKLREYDLKVSGIDVRTSFAEDLPETSVDPYQLEQVFINLINNARDALAGQERAALIIRTYRSDNDILIEFEDNGPGIPDEITARIFDPFFTTKDVGKGTGLGLSMAYGIVKEHNGNISIESKPGQGAKFTVTIPITGDQQPARPEAETSPIQRHGAKSVLIVEDEPSLRNLLSDALTEAGFFAEDAPDGEVAIELLGKRKYDAVVSDIKMPGIGGKEFYLYLSKHQPDIAEKIIFITGDVLSKETQKFLEITNSRFIEKPFNVDALIAMLTDLVSK